LFYIMASITNGISGIIISIIMRLEIDQSCNRLICTENCNIYLLWITLHGLLMIFFLIMPTILGSYGNYLIPIYLGASEVIYPRINNMSVLIVPVSYIIIMLSLIYEYGNGIGWTLYPPLSTSLSLDMSLNLILYSLLVSGISTSLTSINFIVTLHIWKPIIIPLIYMDIYLWSLVLIGYLLIIVLPILRGSLLMILSDVEYNTIFIDPLYGGDPIFYQHLFWFFGHPEVYILIIPGFGLLSAILCEHLNGILYGYQSMILAMSCIIYLGSLVWSHHMFVIGMEIDSRAYFMSSTMLISIPTGSKIFNWLCTLVNRYPVLLNNMCIMYIKMFLIMFTFGGSTGIILGNNVIDISLHDSYYVVSHFHIVLSIGSILSILIGVCYYQEYHVSSSCSISNVLSSFHSISLINGILVTFIPMHLICFNTLPRRISDFPDSIN
jgi:heme/copper-type cytochrome/quinol oxidase subunit 1